MLDNVTQLCRIEASKFVSDLFRALGSSHLIPYMLPSTESSMRIRMIIGFAPFLKPLNISSVGAGIACGVHRHIASL